MVHVYLCVERLHCINIDFFCYYTLKMKMLVYLTFWESFSEETPFPPQWWYPMHEQDQMLFIIKYIIANFDLFLQLLVS